MNLVRPLLLICVFVGLASFAGKAAQESGKLVYADFETMQDNRPVSSRGGMVQLFGYQERPTLQSRFKGLEGANPPAPELVHLRKDDPNRAAAFDYELLGSNQYAGVSLEVHGQPDKNGKPVPDDVSGYKYLTMQLYATGVPGIRVEFISRGNGIDLTGGYPQTVFRVSQGFNTYKVALSAANQPSWVQERVSPKDVFKKLTSISISAYCDQCTPVKGTVVVDNIVFQN